MKRERSFENTRGCDCTMRKLGMKTLVAILVASTKATTAFVTVTSTTQLWGGSTTTASPPSASSYARNVITYMCSTMVPPASSVTDVQRASSSRQAHHSIPTPPSPLGSGGRGSRLGALTLIGAGPGDPDLLTVAAARKLKEAELVIADRLVSPEILELVQGELRVANKHPGCQAAAQDEIFRWMKEGLESGRNVCRLKIGDPFVFGRGGEEVIEARKWGVEASVIPGISSAFSAPLLAGIPVTHRGVANQVTMGTGYGKEYSKPDIANFHPERTAVFLMAVGRLQQLCDDLRLRGYPESCPVAIVENASTPRQRILSGTVKSIPEVAKKHNVKAPATIVVGEVVTVLHGRVEGLVTYKGMGSGVEVGAD